MIKRLNPVTLDKSYLAVRPYRVAPISADFFKLVVNKPWGNEYLMYSSPSVEIWNLFIGHGKATSMHCHPNKKTALVVLDGKALFSSLNESMELSPMCAIIIEPGVFHSTQAISAGGVKVLEFETPPMKHDLIRLEDKYGRVNEGYEGLEKMTPSGGHTRFAAEDVDKPKVLCNSEMCIRSVNNIDDLDGINTSKADLAVIIKGCIESKHGEPLYGVADAFHPGEFSDGGDFIYKDLQFLTIKRAGQNGY